MKEKDWEKFFELVDKIVGMGGTWQEKAAELNTQAEINNSSNNLAELAGWVKDLE